jgi:hypothetical protein
MMKKKKIEIEFLKIESQATQGPKLKQRKQGEKTE